MKTYRAAVIGCGRIGADCSDLGVWSSRIICHAASYSSSPRTRLVAVCDPDPVRLHSAGERWEVSRLYHRHQDLLSKEEIDVVSICTPTATHAEILLDVLEAGVKGVVVEKPLAANLREADVVIDRARRSRTSVAVNYSRRFCPLYQRAAEDLGAGRFGKVRIGRALYSNGLLNNGTHLLDLLRLLFGDPLEVVPLGPLNGDAADPTPAFRVRLAPGFNVWGHGVDGGAFSVFELDIVGTRGRIVFRDLGHIADIYEVGETVPSLAFRHLALNPVSTSTRLAYAIRYAIDDVIDSIETGRPPACTVEDGRAALDLADRVLAAAGRRLLS